ncbi:unnamed protein product [Haemonchus placei]|uniref:WD_REPEATS_REGION domain-containing protein n=1 Tax=Haemonchus placei TaxID=6290 RepID=A0A0N4VT11_HAEPC|nr:unnamed protein product [Haemonchus placei]
MEEMEVENRKDIRIICPNNGGIESVCFVGDHILYFMRRVQICPSPLWSSCAINSTHAALVSHSAALYVFSLEESAAVSNLTLGIDQRLFSVCSRKDIAVGAMDSVYVVKNNAVAHKLVVPRKEKRLPTIVWSCCFFNDVVLACGDSRGVVSFWNSQNGALLNVASHQSEILCLVLCEGRIHAAGVDPRIIRNDFRIVQQRNGPMRDVRAMVYAAGEDHEIFVAKSGCQVLATQNHYLTFRSSCVLEAHWQCVEGTISWIFGRVEQASTQHLRSFNEILDGCGGVTQLAVSPCGRFVAVLTTRLQVFVIDIKTSKFFCEL